MIEFRHPAVFVAEVPFRSTPIEGVATSSTPAPAPAWTDANGHDPGVTLLQAFAWADELLAYRLHPAGEASQTARATRVGTGVVEGLALGTSARSSLTLSPGLALDHGGRVVGDDSADTRRVRRPWP